VTTASCLAGIVIVKEVIGMARPVVLLLAVVEAVARGASGFGPATARANEVAEPLETLEIGYPERRIQVIKRP
jgi:hypothetical protein